MLTLQGDAFTCGRAKFSDYPPVRTESTPKVYVKVQFGDRSQFWLAQLDTGAAWSILAPDIAWAAGISLESGDPAGLSTRLGIKRGNLVRVPFALIADEGDPLSTEATFFVTRDWPRGLSFLGYSGLLDSIRFALDAQKNHFYFGPAG